VNLWSEISRWRRSAQRLGVELLLGFVIALSVQAVAPTPRPELFCGRARDAAHVVVVIAPPQGR
jgi:hypothetical protein